MAASKARKIETRATVMKEISKEKHTNSKKNLKWKRKKNKKKKTTMRRIK
jgi:hypothetical protein